MLSKKPAFLYATNINDYETERGFYYPITSTPFPLARNNNELAYNIKNFDNEKYRQKVEEFIKEKGCIENGHASEHVVDIIEKVISGDYERN
jgi:CDP-glycerol glycerophosphotransferase